MADYKMLMRRPDGKMGIGGPLVIYGIKRVTGIIDTVSRDYAWLDVKDTNYRIRVKKTEIMEYDSNNDTLVGTGNSMYDNGVIDLDNE